MPTGTISTTNKRMEPAEVLRSPVTEIMLTPEDGTLQIDGRGGGAKGREPA